MSRLGVNNNLLTWLSAIKPLNINNSCAVRLLNKKFSADMNLTYLIDNYERKISFRCFMGIRPHGVKIGIYTRNSQINIKYLITNKGTIWYEYINDNIYTRIKISPHLYWVVTQPQVYGFSYTYNNVVATITLTMDLANYRHLRYLARAPHGPKIKIIHSRYGKACSSKEIRVAHKPTYEDMMKLLFEY